MPEKSKILESVDIKNLIIKAKSQIAIARRAGAKDIEKAEKEIDDAIKNFESGEEISAMEKETIAVRYLVDAVINLKRESKWRYYTGYMGNLLGFWSFSHTFILLPIFFILFFFFPTFSFQASGDVHIPLWSLWIAGIGSTTQVFVGVVSDLKKWGSISKYKQTWYWLVPFISLGFGFAAYLIIICGLWTFGSQIPTAAEQHPHLPMLICFLVGYSSDWFREKISSIMEIL